MIFITIAMKKLILLLLLCPLSMWAKFYPGTITMNDGSTKSGYVDPPWWDSNKVSFKPTEKGKTEKIEIENVKELNYTADGKAMRVMTLTLAHIKMFQSEYSLDKDKSWVLVEKSGKGLNLVSIYDTDGGEDGWFFFIHKPDEDVAKYVFTKYGPGTGMMMKYKFIEPYVKINFEKECPEMVKAFTKEVFDDKGVTVVVDLYDQYCN